jgi:hypothetical protein
VVHETLEGEALHLLTTTTTSRSDWPSRFAACLPSRPSLHGEATRSSAASSPPASPTNWCPHSLSSPSFPASLAQGAGIAARHVRAEQ